MPFAGISAAIRWLRDDRLEEEDIVVVLVGLVYLVKCH